MAMNCMQLQYDSLMPESFKFFGTEALWRAVLVAVAGPAVLVVLAQNESVRLRCAVATGRRCGEIEVDTEPVGK